MLAQDVEALARCSHSTAGAQDRLLLADPSPSRLTAEKPALSASFSLSFCSSPSKPCASQADILPPDLKVTLLLLTTPQLHARPFSEKCFLDEGACIHSTERRRDILTSFPATQG